MNKTDELYLYRAPARKLSKAFIALNSDEREHVMYLMNGYLDPHGRPIVFLMKEPLAEAMREEYKSWLGEKTSPDFAKAWIDWVTAFDQIEDMDAHSARLGVAHALTKLLEEVRDEARENRRVPKRCRI